MRKILPSTDMACGDLKALTSRENMNSATFTSSSIGKLMKLSGKQIFTSKEMYHSSPPLCSINLKFVSENTLKDVKKRNIQNMDKTYLGNWAILRHAQNKNDVLTVLGFINQQSKLPDHEYHVRHINLCKFAKVKYGEYMFVSGGMFAVGINDKTKKIMINLDSGSEYFSQSWLNLVGYKFTDKDIITFSRPHVKNALLDVFSKKT